MAKTCPVCGSAYDDADAFCPKDGSTLISARPTGDLVGSVIADRYRVERLLGEGGMGRVYLARHVRLPQQAAIKVMHTTTARDDGAVARFNREAANAARIEHERVARVFDFGEWGDGFVYLAMEYVPGRSLRHLLDQEGRVSPTRAASITYQVAEGLDAAHRLGIVHRDLKPDNIMVVTDDQGVDRCKVVDFGIAKTNEAGGTRLTSTGMIVGTPEFMSPEQIVGEAVDARSDVYALALTAFQMLTGVLPFSGATPERILMARIMQPPATLAEVAPDVAWPDELQAAMTAALQGEAPARTESALAFAEAMVAAVEQWTGGPVLRGRTPLAMPAVTMRGATPAAAARAVEGTAAPTAAGRPAPARGGTMRLAVAAVVLVAAAAGGWYALSGRQGSSAPSASATPTDDRGTAVTTAPAGGGSGASDGAGAPPPLPISPASSAPASAATGQPANRSAQGAPTGGSDPAPTTRDVAAPPATPALPPDAAREGASGAASGSAASGAAAAARRELDSLRAMLAAAESGEEEARAAIPRLQRVLRTLGTASDSTWAYLALVSAMGQAGEGQRACNYLRSARRLASSDLQLRAVQNFFASEALACVP